jgi:hypothetical protein
MSALLLSAFKALGPGPTRREIATVASALRESGDEDVGRLLNGGILASLMRRNRVLPRPAGDALREKPENRPRNGI